MKRLFVDWPLYVEVYILLCNIFRCFMEGKVWPESDFYYTE